MNNITFFELVSFAKVFSKTFAIDRRVSVTREEGKAAIEVLKKINENRNDWTQEQKETYTLCITIAANIAEAAFLGIDACFPDSVVGFTPQVKILSEYVRFFIESQKQRLWAFAPATAQKNINLDTLEKFLELSYVKVRLIKERPKQLRIRSRTYIWQLLEMMTHFTWLTILCCSVTKIETPKH